MDNLLSRIINDGRYKRYLPIFFVILSVIVFSIIIWVVYSAANSPAALQPDANLYAGSTTSIIFSVVFRLMLVLALIYICFGAYRWLQNKKAFISPKKRLSIIETVRMSPRQAIHIVRVDNKEFLVSATDQSMNLLSEIEIPIEDESLDPESSSIPTPGFDQVFQQSIKKSLNIIRGGQKTS